MSRALSFDVVEGPHPAPGSRATWSDVTRIGIGLVEPFPA
jgi:hypothetical protein